MSEHQKTTMDLAGIRARLAGERGRRYWKSLEDVAATPEFQEMLANEFPSQASEWTDDVGRRHFLKLMGASLALAGITACTKQPKETISPYSKAPEDLIPGRPVRYATALTLGGFARGVIVETHEARPTKVEGNPDHPASRGATDVFMQAAMLGLYDPDRSQTVTYLGDIRPWGDLRQVVKEIRDAQKEGNGEGIRFLTEAVTSPTVIDQLGRVLSALPGARWHRYEPVGRENVYEGARMAYGEALATHYRLAEADVILSLDADFLQPGIAGLSPVREFAARRRKADSGMNRLYVVESTPSNTGASADHRLSLPAAEMEHVARAVAAGLGLDVGRAPDASSRLAGHEKWIDVMTRDLEAKGSRAVVMAGEHLPPVVHALAHAINERLGSVGGPVYHTEPVEAGIPGSASGPAAGSIRELAADIDAGRVSLLVILGGNPVYAAPPGLEFGSIIEKVGLRIHLGPYQDETAALCHWHVPQAHELESWADARSFDGTTTILQPMIEPLYEGRTIHELLALFLDQSSMSSHDLVRDTWKRHGSHDGTDAGFERWWRRKLHDGLVENTAQPEKKAAARTGAIPAPSPVVAGGEMEIVFRPDPAVYDGRFANNGWLQELPRPITKLTWDNAALVAPVTAERLGLGDNDIVDLALSGRSVQAPIWIVPGHPADSITVHLGYGRTRAGRVGNGAGFDANVLRASAGQTIARGVLVRPVGGRATLASTHNHQSMEGRDLVRHATLDEFSAEPGFVHHDDHAPSEDESLYPPYKYEGHAWGMVIDLNSCVGCNACVIGCQAENNIPVVGKEQVLNGREMHWIRVDRYFEGSLDDPAIWHQPVPCMQCEDAPCEPVCPVGATVHSSEGLNDMVYNRCVGTRYCSNNCPYKVRRFNFLLFSDWQTPSLKLLRNPDVTVRSRGVMEKCTYCIQRINETRIQSQNEDRPIKDGEILTACQQACPAEAITFGDINDEQSRVAKLKGDPRNYSLLAELGTRPRTTYLAALRNPNPELEKA